MDSQQLINVRMPDGTLIRGVPTTISKQELLDKYARYANNPSPTVSQEGNDRGELRAALQGFNSAVPFGNRITAGLGALGASAITDEKFSDIYKQARADQAATEQASPTANMLGAIAGITSALPIGISKAVSSTPVLGNVANALTKASTATSNFVRGGEIAKSAGLITKLGTTALRGAKAATVAAPLGALYGAGEAPDGQEMEGARRGALVASSVAGAVPVAGAALGATQGTVFDLYVDNTAGANTVTMAVAVNGVLSSAAADTPGSFGDLTIASGATGIARFTLMFASATAYTFSRTA